MKPGRELDALVAEKVMGFKKLITPEQALEVINTNDDFTDFSPQSLVDIAHKPTIAGRLELLYYLMDCYIDNENVVEGDYPNYSTDIMAAWQVVNKLIECFREDCNRKLDFAVHFEDYNGGWVAKFWMDGKPAILSHIDPYDSSELPSHAICLAALKAMGHKFEES